MKTAIKFPVIALVLLTACGGNKNAVNYETYACIADSAIHSDLPVGMVQEVKDASRDNNRNSDVGINVEPSRLTREKILQYAADTYGVSEEWTMWLIGTTWNEDYHNDRYLEYAWACEIVNHYTTWSVYDLDCIWGEFYSIGNAFSGYYAADDITLEMVWQALREPDPRITEVDGMIDYYVPGYYLIYDSPLYDCQVWGN